MAASTRTLAVVGHQASDGAVAQATHLSQPTQKLLCIASVADGLSIALQQLVGVNGSSLALGLCPNPQRLQQPNLLAIHQRLICHQAAVKGPLLVVAPNLGGDGVGFSHCHRVIPATQAVDKRIPAINPQPHLEAAVVVA